MADVIVDVPDELYVRLEEAAKTHQRSLESEILYCIQRMLNPHKADLAYHITAARASRAKTNAYPITNGEINAAKNVGRP